MIDPTEQTMDATHSSHRSHMDPATETFITHRNLLFTVAYQMLGSAADAEDVLQATWLKWVDVDLEGVRNRRAYLVQIAARQALGRLRTRRRRRESYIGLWLPEPLLTAPEVADDVELAENLSMSMLLMMETLTPTERIVFVLREVFDLDYDKIGGPSTRARPRLARLPIGLANTLLPADCATPFRRIRPAMRLRRSSARSKRAICRAYSTYSRRTSRS